LVYFVVGVFVRFRAPPAPYCATGTETSLVNYITSSDG
jgi:hypothetical protein